MKILNVMKLFAFFMLVFVMGASAHSYSQDQLVTLSLHGSNVRTLFKEIRKQTGVQFVFNEKHVGKLSAINVQATDKRLADVLADVFRETGLECRYENEVIFVVPRQTAGPQDVKRGTIKGKVSDKNGPMPGVTVIIKGTSIGVMTDAEGNYSLTLPDVAEPVLLFSFVGMKTQEVKYEGQEALDVVMVEDTQEMDEVVVNGYFTRKTEGFAGAVTTIKKEDLQKVHTSNLFTTLSALDAGFKINDNNAAGSNPNVLPDFTIRGKGSFQEGSSAPLFIVDGFESSVQKVYDMDVNRIESITILKDASATILYGSRAANGVVVVETVKPKPGQLRLTYDFKPSVEIADLTDYDLMNAAEKLEYEKRAGLYEPVKDDLLSTYAREELYYRKYKNVQEGVNTDWLAQPVHNAFSHSHSLMVEGGAENVLYSLDGFYDKNNGVMKGSGRDRYGFGFSLQYRIKEKLIIRNYATYSNMHSYDSPYGSFSSYATANPYECPWRENGELAPTLIDGTANPLYNASLPNRADNYDEYFADNLSADWIVGKGWRLIGQFRVEKGNTRSENYRSPFSSEFMTPKTDPYTHRVTYVAADIEDRGRLTLGAGKYLNYIGKLTANYNKLLADKHM